MTIIIFSFSMRCNFYNSYKVKLVILTKIDSRLQIFLNQKATIWFVICSHRETILITYVFVCYVFIQFFHWITYEETISNMNINFWHISLRKYWKLNFIFKYKFTSEHGLYLWIFNLGWLALFFLSCTSMAQLVLFVCFRNLQCLSKIMVDDYGNQCFSPFLISQIFSYV